MESLYNRNGLVFWTEEEIQAREMMQNYFVSSLRDCLKRQNRAFEFLRCEAPLLTPAEFVNPNYGDDDVYRTADLVLRPETTMGSYRYLSYVLDPYRERKTKLPVVVWQHGKSFRREQDQVTKNMRLKEFHQLEFQIAYSPDTKNDYRPGVLEAARSMISKIVGPCRVEDSDRLPSYSVATTDVVLESNGMELCSISSRTDFPEARVLEVAIGTDRCVANFVGL